jgi:hypothetical protein
MKKEYIKPQMEVVKIAQQSIICTSTIDKIVSSGVFEEEILPGTGQGRAPQFDDLEQYFTE